MNEGLRAAFEAAKADACQLVDGLSESAFNWRRAPGTWSIGECLDHLNVAGQKYLARIDRAMEDGRARGLTGDGPFRYGLIERLLVRVMDAPPRFRFKAPAGFAPASELKRDAALAAFLALQDDLQARLARTEGLDLARIKMRSPVNRRLKISLGNSFEMMAAHQRRHLWQARQVREAPGFRS